MIPRRRIIIITRNIPNTKRKRQVQSRVVQEHLRPARAIVHCPAIPSAIAVLRPGVPEQLAGGGPGWDPVIGVVGHGVELPAAGEFEDFADGAFEVVVCQVRCWV